MPDMICCAATATACRPPAQKRLSVCPATVTGRPAARAAMRPMFMPCSASGRAQPSVTSSTSCGGMPARATAACTTAAAMSSGRMVCRLPCGALPTAVRTAETMTAFFMVFSLRQWGRRRDLVA